MELREGKGDPPEGNPTGARAESWREELWSMPIHDPDDDGPSFACERGGFWETSSAGLLGAFDGRDSRDLHAYAVAPGDEQLLVSMHEHLHHELQWSTGWGVVAAMAGLLAESGVRTSELQAVADFANRRARHVHEVFATTISCGVIGVAHARTLLEGNRRYSRFLEQGLSLGGDPAVWPWQFRESATQVLLRTLMQPVELKAVADIGFEQLTVEHLHRIRPPDTRLASARGAGQWWADTFAQLFATHPSRGGDSGDLWTRSIPAQLEEMEQLKEFEEVVLIPALAATAHQRLTGLGFGCLDGAEYLEVVTTLQTSFSQLAPPTWQVELLTDRRPMTHEPLGAERERIQLHQLPASAMLVGPDEVDDATFVLRQHGASPTVLLTYLTGRAYADQFGLTEIAPLPAVLAIAGWPSWADEPGDSGQSGEQTLRQVPLALLAPSVTPRQVMDSFADLPVCLLTALSVTREPDLRDHVLEAPTALVLVDLPLSMQLKLWVDDGWTVRFAAVELRGSYGLTLLLFRLDGLPNLLFLSYRSTAGFGELAQLLDRFPEQLLTGLAPDEATMNAVTAATAWIFGSWWRLQEAENL